MDLINRFKVDGYVIIPDFFPNQVIQGAVAAAEILVDRFAEKLKGDLLGLCGNSGNSSEPHLHFHIQNVENIIYATGVKCYFDEIIVNGELMTDYSPIKDEKIINK